MHRRLFLQFPLVASAIVAQANDSTNEQPPKKGFKVEGHKDRYQEELHIMGGQFDCKISSKDSNGELLLYDTYRHEKGGPGLHYHQDQDEWFYVVSGEFIIKVGDETFTLKAGDSAFAPRRIPHAFAKINDGPAQMLVAFQPAGKMEDFFKEMAKLGPAVPGAGGPQQQERLKKLWHDHGMELVGPPLAIPK